MVVLCHICQSANAVLKRCATQSLVCRTCFIDQFEHEIHRCIIDHNLFTSGDNIAIGASGGKDSTVLAHVLCKLNQQYHYGINLFLLSIDEGISGYRDDSLECVKSNQLQYNVPLHIVSYKELYGWTMDEIVKQIGRVGNCTFCGVFRRQALDRGAIYMKANKLVTGHNGDDMAETIVMNMLRGDINRLGRTVDITTGACQHTDEIDTNLDDTMFAQLPRCKPFKYTYEKEIVLYAYHQRLLYFSTECIYSPFAYRGFAREYIKQLERIKPASILDIITSAEAFSVSTAHNVRRSQHQLTSCTVCGYLASNSICKACALLEGLEKGKAKLQVQDQQGVQLMINNASQRDTTMQSQEIGGKPTATHVNDW